jgi:hypothetical protein
MEMDMPTLAAVLRMLERSLIVAGGILSIYLGYKLFVLGIDKTQGEASAFGVELKNFGPGLFFAALGAVVLVTTMRASIKVGNQRTNQNDANATGGNQIFVGLEDSSRSPNGWADTAFYLETKQLLQRIDAGESVEDLENLRTGLTTKLDSITMTDEEYALYQVLTGKVPLSLEEQKQLIILERKLVP